MPQTVLTRGVPTRAVVTGAARGIGRAVAARLVAEGWQVVVSDLDAAELETAAAVTGAHPVPADVATDAGVAGLLSAASEHLGQVDAFFGNAGIALMGGLDTPDADWARILEVNVMAHVRAARRLVPEWVERGGGRFVVTASAAGLLTMLQDLPYSVTKHAAVALVEWINATYRHHGIVAQAVCPQGVQTRILEQSGPLAGLLSHDRALTAEQVADSVWAGLQTDVALILPHPEVHDYYVKRATDPDGWLAGMNHLQQKLEQHIEAQPERQRAGASGASTRHTHVIDTEEHK
ncbi:MAG: SDR family oxidoreductase [Intrasporangium sp.]|uniref:SDR family oxidoreductase n=1 Tax=Intrasporangium sp. TaxID=1925024 RepID=UPI0026483E10|nr:SDR family oxidoreductase [Intrasporangium sp.]MDN5795744.1 SDR family oxidoreductase [Intrasporangium sp.]